MPPDREVPRIYVADLAAYVGGMLVGAWMESARPDEEVWADINKMLADSPTPGAEEIAVHDYEGYYALKLGEYTPIETYTALGRAILEHGEPLASFVHYEGTDDLDEVVERFEDAYIGNFDSEEQLGDHLLEEMGAEAQLEEFRDQMVEGMRHYLTLDRDAFVHDLDVGGEVYIHMRPDYTVDCFWAR